MSPERKKPQDYIPLTPRTFHILLALKDEPVHGYSIMKQVEEQSSGQVKIGPGTLYEAIGRMVESELLREVSPPRNAAKDKRKRRFYRITPLGRKVMRLEAERLAELVGYVRAEEVLST